MKPLKCLLAAALVAAALAPPLAAQDAPAGEEAMYLSLQGGGELIGSIAKETPASYFIDIGPSIVEIRRDSVSTMRPLSELAEMEPDPEAATGVLDPRSGSAIARDADGDRRLLSQTEIVDDAKKSVVLISNPRGAGSGFILDEEGRVVTNHHVINREKYHTVNIFRRSGDQWERVRIDDAEVEAYSPLYDIAILRLPMDQVEEEGLELRPLPIAEPGSLKVGDPVYAIGNPGMGRRLLEHTVSEGIVSSLARNVSDVLYVQTTAAVNPGNSGGPLVNDRGEVVGLVTLKAFFQEGIAFALPVDLMRHFLRYSESFAFSEQSGNEGFRYLPPEYETEVSATPES